MRKIVKKDLGILGLCVATFAVLQALISLNFIDPFWELNIILIGINIILAAGLNLINGYTGQFSLGHAGFMAVGAYVSAIVTMKLGLPFIVAIMAGACAAQRRGRRCVQRCGVALQQRHRPVPGQFSGLGVRIQGRARAVAPEPATR